MNIVYRLLMIVVGSLLFYLAQTKSQNKLYQLVVSRSQLMWKDKVYHFHKVSGLLIIVVGVLYALKLF